MSGGAGNDSSHVHVVVLAAGASTRFGSAKQLIRVNGRPLMLSAVSRAVELAGHSVTVVLGSQAAELAPLLRHSPASVAINREWSEGIASSIRAGLAHTPNPDGRSYSSDTCSLVRAAGQRPARV